MADVHLERDFNTTAERLFEILTTQSDVLNWWGHDGMTLPEYQLDFSRTGPWFSRLIGSDGKVFKMSGQVTKVDPPHSVSFTWGWHDDADVRGADSHVTYKIATLDEGRVRLTLDHRDLPSKEVASHHESGWANGPLTRLERYITALAD